MLARRRRPGAAQQPQLLRPRRGVAARAGPRGREPGLGRRRQQGRPAGARRAASRWSPSGWACRSRCCTARGRARSWRPTAPSSRSAPRTGEAVVVADIDVALADDKRRPDGTDVMTSRRPDLYGPILDAPRGRQRAAGADELVTAVVSPADGDDVPTLLADALATGAGLVVLPELAEVDPDAIVAALAGTDALVATSVAEGDAHVGLVLSADGVVLRQPQLHAERPAPLGHRARRRARRRRPAVGPARAGRRRRRALPRDVPARRAPGRRRRRRAVHDPDRRRPRPAAARAGGREPAQRRGRQPSR